MSRRIATLAWGLASLGFVAIGVPSAHAWDPFSVAVFEPSAEPGLVYFERGANIIAQDPFEGDPKTIAAGRPPAVSQDGRRLTYVRDSDGRDHGRPAWSPDGRHIAVTDFGAGTAAIVLVDKAGAAPRAAVEEDLEGIGRTLLSSAMGAVIDDGVGDGVITDDDAPAQPVSIADATALEGLDLRFEVGLAAPAATTVTVTATTMSGSAVSPGDFTSQTTQVEIPAGLSNAGFVVTTLDDILDEPAETFTVTLSDAVGATIEDGTATGTIVDKSRITVVAPAPVLEGGTLRFPVRLDHAAPSEVTVGLETQDGTATAPGDYAARSETFVTLAAGQTEAFFDVPTGTDFLDEPDETVTARIVSSNGPATLAALSATGTIQNKPPPSVSVGAAPTVTEGGALAFPVRLTGSRPGPVTVELTTQDGSAQAPGDYSATTTTLTIPAGQDEAQFVVPTVDDGWDEPDETVTARITRTTNVSPTVFSATATIRDNDEPLPNVRIDSPATVDEGDPLRFPIRLDRAGPGPIDIRLSTADGTAVSSSDYTAQSSTLVRIPAGATEAFLDVPTVNDAWDEPDETLTARIVSTINAVPTLLSATGTIRDNDEPLPTVQIDTPTAVDEGGTLRFPLRLDRATPGPVDIRVSTVDGTATAPGDYTAQTLTLVRIPAGASEGSLEVPTATDQLTESDETVRVEIKSTINVLPTVLSATGTIRDADGPVQLVPGRLHQGKLITGKVLVKPPRSNTFIDLGAAAGLPVGTQIDARAGEIELTMAVRSRRARTSATRRARFSGGVFTIRQARAWSPVTVALSGNELRRCRRDGKAARRLSADGAGGFVTHGRYASASSRNGRWLTEDRCTSTRISVTRGRVTVRDSVRERTRTVRAPRALTISPRRAR